MNDKTYQWRLYHRGITSHPAATVSAATKADAEAMGFEKFGRPMDADLVRGAK